MWNIKQTQNHTFDCLTGLLTAYADSLGIDYRFCFSKNLGFYFIDTKGHLLSEKIHFCRPYSFFDMYEKYCNIYILENKHDDLYSLQNYAKALLQVSPIIFDIDAFNCHWCPVYNKFHFNHHLMIVDMDDIGFYCFDAYFPEMGIQKIEFSSLQNWAGTSKRMQVLSSTSVLDISAYRFEIQDTVNYLENIDYIFHLKKLQNYFRDEDNLFRNFEGFESGPNHSPFFLILRTFVMQKKQFVLVLDFLKEIGTENEQEKLNQIANIYNEIKNLYSSVHTTTLKQLITQKRDASRQVLMLEKVIEKEELAMNLLKEYLS